jgi:hypothetical protein
MKRIGIYLSALCLVIVSCTNDQFDIETPPTNEQSKLVTFTFGKFTQQAMTRASVAEVNMTDLWMFDYIGDELQQTIHQSSSDEGFGVISTTMAYGNHILYFITSRGTTPTVNTEAHKITWEKPSDTFWATTTMTVSASSGSSQAIALQRAVTRFKITLLDEVPSEAAKVTVTPAQWYYGIDYTTGIGVDAMTNQPRAVTIPSSYIGTSGELSLSVFSFVPSDDWHTDVSCVLSASDESVLGSVTLENVGLKKNITTAYSGYILSNNTKTFTLTVDDTWGTEEAYTW